VRLPFALRELEEPQRALDVDLVGGQRRELGAGGQQRGEVEDEIHLELGEHPLEQCRVCDRAREFAPDERRQAIVEPGEVDGDDGAPCAGQPRDETVTDLATSAGDQRDGRPHADSF
jgi:hypothetical protein